jgi:hypothetical protein
MKITRQELETLIESKVRKFVESFNSSVDDVFFGYDDPFGDELLNDYLTNGDVWWNEDGDTLVTGSTFFHQSIEPMFADHGIEIEIYPNGEPIDQDYGWEGSGMNESSKR